MQAKNCNLIKPLSCKMQASVADAAKMLRDSRQRRIIVVDENEAPVGIISTTDINNKVVAEERDASKLKVSEIMTSPIYLVCDFEDDLDDIFKKMINHETFFVPVLRDGRLYGVLTYGELLSHVREQLNDSK